MYGMAKTECSEPCRPSLAATKKRLKEAQDALRMFIEVSGSIEIDYNERNRVIGSMYMQTYYLESEIENIKRMKKSKKKENK